ncbi:MAG: outer membrane protein assembly factor BamA [Gammaproteobacteria bacterium]|nr:outer membrane protein assembly factor BamA [Gammaproteobacteria bacterium]
MKHPSTTGKAVCHSVLRALLICLCLTAVTHAADDEFVLGDIRIEGLQRISSGTIFNYLPLNIGDTVDRQRLQEALRAVYSTEFFQDIEFRREGDTLIIAVIERPSIADFTIEGNKDIKTEDLLDSLSRVGLKKGRILNRSVLEDVERSLTDEYFSRGKYAASVVAEVEELPDNKVEININITEGDRSRIRQINIVGNSVYDDEELLDVFQLRTPNLLSFIRQDDRYSREALQGDLETLRSYYMDRGYADFVLDSVQVAISPDKKDIYITINIAEGDVYTISDVKLAGDLILPETSLQPFVQVRPGQIYSQRLLTGTEELIQLRLGEEGYAFTDVEPVTELDKESRSVEVTFYVDPKNRVYVRRINFNGADSVNDAVFRREMRQFEGAYLSQSKVDRSKIRLQRLPYIESVDVETNPVAGTPDLVDVEFDITEGLPGQFGGGIGFSQAQGVLLNGNFVHTNFMGTGNRVQADVNIGQFRTIVGASYTNPYAGLNEVSRTLSASYRNATQFTAVASDLDTTTLSAGVNWSYPVTEFQRVSIGFNFQSAQLDANTASSSEQALEWVRNNGDVSLTCIPFSCDESTPGNSFVVYSSEFRTVEVAAGWNWDTRNRALFADRGWRHSLGVGLTIPALSEVEYASVNYNYIQYIPFTRYFTFAVDADIAYGQALGDTSSVPPYRNFFAGGPNSVRGYREVSLGPRDSRNNPYGGNLLVAGSVELILPIPRKWQSRSRFVLFYDVGNVFSTEGTVPWTDATGQLLLPADFYDFDVRQLRTSIGIGAEWLAPLGLFRFSYGIPLNESAGAQVGPIRILPDEIERFQFNIGGAF